MVKIFAPTPSTKPSLLNSIAGEVMAFEKPVIGTNVPAPATFAILSNTLKPVSNDAITIKVTGTKSFTTSGVIFK